jgi:Flp pilus assembly protein CpaB
MNGGTGRLAVPIAALLMAASLATGCPERARSQPPGPKVGDVIVAAHDLEPGAFLSNDHVAVDKMQVVSEAMLRPSDMEVALGREVAAPVKKGEPIFWHQLRGIEAFERLSRLIRRGLRAVLLEVGPEVRMIRRNDRVDVLRAFVDPKTGEGEARVLLQSVIVIETDCRRTVRNKLEGPCRSVALLLTQEEAALLALARRTGQVTLAVRNGQDRAIVEEPPQATIETLRDARSPLKSAREREAAIKAPRLR